MDEKLAAVIQRYLAHPEFLGIEITDLNQPGAVDDALLHWAARTSAIDDHRTLVIVRGASQRRWRPRKYASSSSGDGRKEYLGPKTPPTRCRPNSTERLRP